MTKLHIALRRTDPRDGARLAAYSARERAICGRAIKVVSREIRSLSRISGVKDGSCSLAASLFVFRNAWLKGVPFTPRILFGSVYVGLQFDATWTALRCNIATPALLGFFKPVAKNDQKEHGGEWVMTISSDSRLQRSIEHGWNALSCCWGLEWRRPRNISLKMSKRTMANTKCIFGLASPPERRAAQWQTGHRRREQLRGSKSGPSPSTAAARPYSVWPYCHCTHCTLPLLFTTTRQPTPTQLWQYAGTGAVNAGSTPDTPSQWRLMRGGGENTSSSPGLGCHHKLLNLWWILRRHGWWIATGCIIDARLLGTGSGPTHFNDL